MEMTITLPGFGGAPAPPPLPPPPPPVPTREDPAVVDARKKLRDSERRRRGRRSTILTGRQAELGSGTTQRPEATARGSAVLG